MVQLKKCGLLAIFSLHMYIDRWLPITFTWPSHSRHLVCSFKFLLFSTTREWNEPSEPSLQILQDFVSAFYDCNQLILVMKMTHSKTTSENLHQSDLFLIFLLQCKRLNFAYQNIQWILNHSEKQKRRM